MARAKRAIHAVDEADILCNVGQGNKTKLVFAKRLNEEMVRQGVTQQELCKDTGIADGSLSSYRNGKSEPKASNIALIARRLKVSSDYLLDLSNDRTTDKDEKGVCKYTGLSAGGVRLLHNSKKEKLTNIIVNGAVDALLADFDSSDLDGHPVLTSISLFMNVNTSESSIEEQLAIFPDGEIKMVDESVEPFKTALKKLTITKESPIFKNAMRRIGISILQRSEFESFYMLEVQKSLKTLKNRYIDAMKRKGC